jgi:spore maturation protein B
MTEDGPPVGALSPDSSTSIANPDMADQSIPVGRRAGRKRDGATSGKRGQSMAGLLEWISVWAVPVLIGSIPLFGWLRGVSIFDSFVAGAEEGFRMAVRMIPFLVGILVALSIFQTSGALDRVIGWLSGPLGRLGIPAEVVPLMLVKPLSGGAALGITSGILQRNGPDSPVGELASLIQGSTDTTFYVLTLYFGSVGIKKTRYALPVALLGDLAGFVAAVAISHRLFG